MCNLKTKKVQWNLGVMCKSEFVKRYLWWVITAESGSWGIKFSRLEQLDEVFEHRDMEWQAGNDVWWSSEEERVLGEVSGRGPHSQRLKRLSRTTRPGGLSLSVPVLKMWTSPWDASVGCVPPVSSTRNWKWFPLATCLCLGSSYSVNSCGIELSVLCVCSSSISSYEHKVQISDPGIQVCL